MYPTSQSGVNVGLKVDLTHLGTDSNGHRLGLGAKDKLGALGVEEVELVGVAAHGSIVLLDKEPANLILGNLVLLLFSAGSGTGRGRGLSGLEVCGGVHGSVGGVEGIGEAMLGGIVAVDRDLSHIGHFGIEKRRYDIREGKKKGRDRRLK
jgi:hypothetical protein